MSNGVGNPIQRMDPSEITTPGYDQGTYAAEKALGIRNARTGWQGLKKLKARHYLIIHHHLAGKRTKEIADMLNMDYAYVNSVLHDPLVEIEISAALEEHRVKLKNLQGAAVDAVGSALTSSDERIQLSGVDRFVKLGDALGVLSDGQQTAEDIAQKLIQQVNIQINMNR